MGLAVDVWGYIIGAVSLVALVAAAVRKYLPSVRMKELQGVLADMNMILSRAIEAGYLPDPAFIARVQQDIEVLDRERDDLRERTLCATTFFKECREGVLGLSREIGVCMDRAKELRATVVATKEVERQRQLLQRRQQNSGGTGTGWDVLRLRALGLSRFIRAARKKHAGSSPPASGMGSPTKDENPPPGSAQTVGSETVTAREAAPTTDAVSPKGTTDPPALAQPASPPAPHAPTGSQTIATVEAAGTVVSPMASTSTPVVIPHESAAQASSGSETISKAGAARSADTVSPKGSIDPPAAEQSESVAHAPAGSGAIPTAEAARTTDTVLPKGLADPPRKPERRWSQ